MRTLLAGLALAAPLLAGCGTPPNCGALPQPEPVLVDAARVVVGGEAVEVEAELENDSGTSECVVDSDSGRWVNATDADEA